MRVLAIIFVLFSILSAELSPQVYQEWKSNADVVGIIKVVDTNITIKDNIENIVAKAEVIKLDRTNIRVPKYIIIKYKKTHIQDPLIVGPAPILTLQKGKTYSAYLNKKDTYYIPAAGGQSFEGGE